MQRIQMLNDDLNQKAVEFADKTHQQHINWIFCRASAALDMLQQPLLQEKGRAGSRPSACQGRRPVFTLRAEEPEYILSGYVPTIGTFSSGLEHYGFEKKRF
jgi:hypothetical protein